MKSTRQIALSLALSLMLPGMALAAPETSLDATQSIPNTFATAPADASAAPTTVSQSLPPIQGSGYSANQSYTNYGSGQYQQPAYNQSQYTQPQYGQYNQAPAQQQYSQPQYGSYSQQPPLQGYVVTAPAGTVVNATFSSPISSEYARVGDRFTATLGSPVAAGSSVVLPAGSQMEGQVVMVKPAGRTGRNGELDIRFTSAMLPNGQRVPLSARIQTEDGTGIIKGGSTGGRVGRAVVTTGVGAGLGAALGTAMGPLAGGEVGRGAIYGTILGAGMGALGAAVQKGKPALLESGQPVNVVLDQPLTTSPATDASSAYQQQPSQNYYQNPAPANFYGGQ